MNQNSNNNINETPLTDIDYEGVVYEPSKDSLKYKENNIKNTTKTKEKIKKAPNFNFSIFLGITISIGVVIFALVAILTYSSLSNYINLPKNNSSLNLDNNTNNNIDNESLVLDTNTNQNIIGIIKNIDYEKNIFTFSDIKTNKVYTLKSKSTTEFKDKYENMLTISELEIGNVVDFSFDTDNKLNYVYENKNSFYLENISNTKINTELNTLSLNDKTYKINDNAIILRNNEEYELSKISSVDILDIKGYNNTIYFIELKKGNGILKLENKPALNKAVIEIDRDIFKSLEEIDSINLSEGKHKIVIRSEDTISFVKEIDIISGQETILDLSEIQNKSGTLYIKSNITDYTLYINNVIETSREPLKLHYGTYNIRAEKEGYNPFQAQVSINGPQANVEIKLEKIEKMGKININSTPDNTEVFINNNFVGYTPLVYKVPHGVHTITLKKSGYNDFVLSSVTIGDEESSFNITMHKSNTDTSSNTTTTITSSTNTESTKTTTNNTDTEIVREPTI